jgi:hypothetical protein
MYAISFSFSFWAVFCLFSGPLQKQTPREIPASSLCKISQVLPNAEKQLAENPFREKPRNCFPVKIRWRRRQG